MKLLKSAYALAGRQAFRLGLPFWRYYLRQSYRAYVLLTNDGEILAIKSWLNNGVWHMPGGGIRNNESAEQAVRREVAEELGIEIGSVKLSLVAQGQWQTDQLDSQYRILKGQLPNHPHLKLKRPEILEAAWMKPHEFTSQNTPAEMLAAIKKL